MLSGHRLFEGETVSHTPAQMLTAPVGFNPLLPKIPQE